MVATVESKNFQKYGLRLRDKKLVGEPLAEVISEATLLTERHAKQGAPYDVSPLKRSLVGDAQPMHGRVFSTLNYAAPMEFGRSAGQKPPPPESLVGWLSRHGNFTTPWVLARAIARRGVKGRFFMKKAAQKTQDALPGMLTKMGIKIDREFSK